MDKHYCLPKPSILLLLTKYFNINISDPHLLNLVRVRLTSLLDITKGAIPMRYYRAVSVTSFFPHSVFSTISHSYVWSHSLPPKCTRLMHLKLKIFFLPQQHASGPPRMVQRPATKVSRNPLSNIKTVYCQKKAML